jgi:hypothetical protein
VFVGLRSVTRSCQTSLSATGCACLPDVQVSETVSCSRLQCLAAGSSAVNLPLYRLLNFVVVEVVVVFVDLRSVTRSCQPSLSATGRACLPDAQVSETVSCSQLQCLVAGSSA